jgi:hypothetical protein
MTTKGIPRNCDDGMDTRKFNGVTYYAWGEYRLGAVGKKFADKHARTMKANGHNTRIVKRTTGYQVYCNSKLGVMGLED